MERVVGVTITAFCDQHRLTVRERLDLFLQVCCAVQHAHQKGIIHRDLKPSNILVSRIEERPVAKVIDFGIAKATRELLTDKTLLTRQSLFMGTPAYMSPEQIGNGSADVDTRSDIYSLGALLYELVSGAPTLDVHLLLAQGYAAVQQAVQVNEPPAPSQRISLLDIATRHRAAEQRHATLPRWIADVRGDLDRIVLKCLQKDRVRRYDTAEELARDLSRFLRHEPVLARPTTFGYRAAKFVRRHRSGVTATVVALTLAAGFGLYHTRHLAAERDRAQFAAAKAAKVSALLTDVLITADPFRSPSPHGQLETSVARVREEFAGQPEVRAEILNAVGRVYLRRGEHDKARPVLEEALEAGRKSGPPDSRLAFTLSDLGVLYKDLGDLPGSVRLLEEALAIRRGLWPKGHNDVAVTLVELGRVQNTLERFDLAEPLLREALTIRRAVLGPEHREVAVSLGDLAVLLWHKGDFSAAEHFFDESLAMHRKTLGGDHPNVGQGMTNWALLKIDQGDITGAEELLQGALPIFRRSFGEKHWRTARLLGHIGMLRRKQTRFAEAAAALDEALQMAQAALPADRPIVAALKIDRAQVHLDQGEIDAAEPLLREALRVQRLSYIENGWRIASTKSLLAAALLGLDRIAEAEPLLIDANRILKDMPGPQGRETQPTLDRLATLSRVKREGHVAASLGRE
jgi:tetratricopeptide (TPR) repeat protein